MQYWAVFALLAALAAGFGNCLNAWRQSVYPNSPPRWLGHAFLFLAIAFGVAFCAVAVRSFAGLQYSLELPLGALLIIAFFAAVVLTSLGVARGWLRLPLPFSWRRERPDFDEVDKLKRFKLWEAACLWVDQRPKMPLSRSAIRAVRQLEAAIKEKTLSVTGMDLREAIYDAADELRGRATKANPNWIVSKEALLTYARTVGKKPKFLFPKERTA